MPRWAVRITIDLQPDMLNRAHMPLRGRAIQVGSGGTIDLVGKDRAVQRKKLTAFGSWQIGLPPKLGPYERMTLVRLCVALESVASTKTEHDLGPEFEEDLEAIRSRPWPGAISELGLVL